MEFQTSELPAIVIEENSPIEGQDGVRVFSGRSSQQETSCHSEMDHQVSTPVQGQNDKLAVTLDGGDFPALNACGHAVGIATAQDTDVAEFGRSNSPSDERRD